MARLFVALEMPTSVSAGLGALAEEIAVAKRLAAWPLHVTLRFLGEQGPKDDPKLERRIEEIGARLAEVRYTAFACTVRGLGCFPVGRPRRARVLFANLEPPDPIAALKRAVDAVLGPDPELENRGYTPHVTLARFGAPPGHPVEAALARHADLRLGPWTIDAFSLFQSTSSPQGARYLERARFALAQGPTSSAGPAPPATG